MSHRIERLNHLIREEISELMQRQVKDPRLGGFVTVTGVETTADLKNARVYISYYGTEAEKQATLAALSQATGFFRNGLAKRLTLRRVPEISFYWDDSIEHGAYIEELIDRVSSENSSERNP